MPKKKTKEEFIKRAREVHGDKYDYSKVVYINNHTKVKIICPIHGEFNNQIPNSHTRGKGCPKCGYEKLRQLLLSNIDEFIEKSRKIHGNKYDYSKAVYINDRSKVKIICPIHGEFEKCVSHHLQGQGCNTCGNNRAARKQSLTRDEFIKRAREVYGDFYDYSEVVYINYITKVKIICPIHGEFEVLPPNHLNNHRCNKCAGGNYSKGQIEWLEWRMVRDKCFIQHSENIGEKVIEHKNGKYKLDGFCIKTQIAYEYDGDKWHGNPEIYNPKDRNPMNNKLYSELYEDMIKRKEYIINQGFHYISIWESEWLHIKKCIKIIQRWWKKNK